MTPPDDSGTMAVLDLGPTTRGRKPKDVPLEVVRPLTPEDIPYLTAPATPTPPANPSTPYLRYRHQQLAQLVARGVPEVEICAITGYSASWLSTLLHHDQMFKALVAHYREQQEIAFVDLTERMRVLGISAVEELQTRIDDAPDKWTKQELIQLMAEVTKGIGVQRAGVPAAQQSAGPVTVNLNFVKPQAAPQPSPNYIDLEPTNG